MTFIELKLKPELLGALEEMGYRELTPVQEKTFPHILAGRDLIATAETGSGKTSACAVPIVQGLEPEERTIQVLILVPTRELALQYVEEIGRVAQRTPVVPFAIYGGFDMDIQKAKLQDGVNILVATPGRLIDLLYGGHMTLSAVRTLVLDEADEMLKQGFMEDIDFIISCLVHEHQTLLFSATMPAEVRSLAGRYLREPVQVALNAEQVAPTSLRHVFKRAEPGERLQVLVDYLGGAGVRQAIIFCNSRFSVEQLHDTLKGRLPRVEMIHGGLEQGRRTSIIRRFRARGIQFMVATDLAGRGLDFRHVSHIVNYDVPRDPETYTHRTGRTARMGREGVALTLLGRRSVRLAHRIVAANRLEAEWADGEPGAPPPADRADRRRRSGGSGRSRPGQRRRRG